MSSYLVGADRRPRPRWSRYDALSKQWALKVWTGRRLAQCGAEAKTAAIETPNLEGLGRDGRSILIGEWANGHYELRELSPDGGRLSDPLPGPMEGENICTIRRRTG